MDRIEQLLLRRARRLEIDADTIALEAMKNLEASRAIGDMPSANRALQLLGESIGVFSKRAGGNPGAQVAIVFGNNAALPQPTVIHADTPSQELAGPSKPVGSPKSLP